MGEWGPGGNVTGDAVGPGFGNGGRRLSVPAVSPDVDSLRKEIKGLRECVQQLQQTVVELNRTIELLRQENAVTPMEPTLEGSAPETSASETSASETPGETVSPLE